MRSRSTAFVLVQNLESRRVNYLLSKLLRLTIVAAPNQWTLLTGNSEVRPVVALIAENDITEQFAVWKTLKANGFEPIAVRNGERALQISRQFSGEINILRTNFNLPGMTGLELFEKLS